MTSALGRIWWAPYPGHLPLWNLAAATTTGDPGVPSCQSSVSRSIWFKFTPSTTGLYYFSTCQSDAPLSMRANTVMEIYTASAGCGSTYTSVACDDDGCTTQNNQSVISGLSCTAGTDYYIVVWSSGAGAGNMGERSISLFVNAEPDMTFSSDLSTQPDASAVPGATNVQIYRLRVTTGGGVNNPLEMQTINVDMTGTTNNADILSAKCYYTTGGFATTTPFGATQNAPGTTFSFTGTQSLTFGNNNFWVCI